MNKEQSFSTVEFHHTHHLLSHTFEVELKEKEWWVELQSYQKKDWVFRGQVSYDNCELQTSLERMCSNIGLELKLLPKMEQVLLREFKRRYHHYNPSPPEDDHNSEWLSIMQHHGAPTRFLDFSYSIYIATYFALEAATTSTGKSVKSEIWAINKNWIEKRSAERLKEGSLGRTYIEAKFDRKNEDAFNKIAFGENEEEPKDLVFMVNPFRLNERLSIQQGVFLCPGNIQHSFMENLEALPNAIDQKNVYILKIPAECRNEGIERLYNMGISRASLFPGLDGFSKSLYFTIPLIWKDKV